IYRPLTTLSFLIDWLVSGGQATWFHIMNALWNAAACALAFLLLTEFFELSAALFGALVFALHPVHVEAVANIVGRAEMISAVFMLWACLLWVKRPADRDANVVAKVTALFMLALCAKESAVMLGPLLVLLDFAASRWSLERRSIAHYLN